MPRKDTVLTFKADPALATALRAVPNRSDFIRAAILAALDSSCPLCGGTGILSTHQQQHWEQMRQAHQMKKCGDCDEFVMVCDRQKPHHHHPAKPARKRTR